MDSLVQLRAVPNIFGFLTQLTDQYNYSSNVHSHLNFCMLFDFGLCSFDFEYVFRCFSDVIVFTIASDLNGLYLTGGLELDFR